MTFIEFLKIMIIFNQHDWNFYDISKIGKSRAPYIVDVAL